MADTHQYRVVAWWASARTGTAKSDSAPNAIHFTAPLQFGGVEGRWTPEDLLLSAVASCYTTTFRALAERSKFEYADLEVEAQGTIHRANSGYHFSEIIMRPNSDDFERRRPGTGARANTESRGAVSRLARPVNHADL